MTETNLDEDDLKLVCQLQETNPSASLSILRAFLHLNKPFYPRGYPSEFVQYEIEILKRSPPVSAGLLFELLQQLVKKDQIITSYNIVRQTIVESWVDRFRQENAKIKWGGNGEKIEKFAGLLQESLNFLSSNEESIRNSSQTWYSIVLHLYESTIVELNEWLKNKIAKHQHQMTTLSYLIKPLGQLTEQLNKIKEKSNSFVINDYFSNIFLSNLQQQIDSITNKKILDQFDLNLKLDEYRCPRRHCLFMIHPEFSKLLVLFNDGRIATNSSELIFKCTEQLGVLSNKVFTLLPTYPSAISFEHCVYLLSCISSLDILCRHESYQYLLHNFSQYLLTYWQIHLLHDSDAEDWSNTKNNSENKRYSPCIDAVFRQLNRFQTLLQQFCSSLLPIFIPFLLLELMNFLFHRYASIKTSHSRQQQYRMDLLALLVHSSVFTHYFFIKNSSTNDFLLMKYSDLQSTFLQMGDEILSALVLVTCPFDLLAEELEHLNRFSNRKSPQIHWLDVIRPDWFDDEEQFRSDVLTFFTIENIIQTHENQIPMEKLIPLIMKNHHFAVCRIPLCHWIMENERWTLIESFVKHEHDWSFLNKISAKTPEWLGHMMEYWREFFIKCTYLCANSNEIEWRTKLCRKLHRQDVFDEKTMYLKSLQHYLINLPLSLHHVLQAIHQEQPQINKRQILAHLLYKFMSDQKIDRVAHYHSYLTEHDNEIYPSIERLIDRKSLLFRFPHFPINDEQTNWKYITRIYECLNRNSETIRRALEVKRLDEFYNIQPLYPQMSSQQQQTRTITQSIENLHLDSTNDQTAFTDFNPLSSRRILDQVNTHFSINTALINSIQPDWSRLFNSLIIRMRRSAIYHFVTLRFELQKSSESSLDDMERRAVTKLFNLLPQFRTDRH